MKSARFDRLLTILRRTNAKDSLGQAVQTYQPDASPVWATKRDMSAKERFAAGERTVEASAVFVIRWRSDLTTRERVQIEGKIYEVVHLREIGRKDGLEIMCNELVR